jgi:heat-inducible transcriptional repressor
MAIDLTSRQREILRHVIEEFVATGRPVGSQSLVRRAGLEVSASTVRSDLAELESRGLLTHPHTSAGRVPTERGYRFYASGLLARLEPRPPAFPLDLTSASSEVDAALRATADMLSSLTRLLALVSAPPLETTILRHVEVLLLQPQVLMVVVITSTGGVTKRTFVFGDAVDPGLAHWAREYLNDQLAGVQLGTRLFRQRLEDPGLSQRERAFLAVLRPALTEHVVSDEQRVYVGGAADLLGDAQANELEACRRLIAALEKRATLLELVGEALEPQGPFVRVGAELRADALTDISLVGATYGLANRTLGAVGLLGPVRMDYDKALRSVRAAAHELSRFVEDVYADN